MSAPGRPIRGGTSVVVPGEPGAVLTALLDPSVLRRAVPAAESVVRLGEGRYRAVLSVGVGPLRVRQTVDLALSPGAGEPGRSFAASGTSSGALAWGEARGEASLEPLGAGRTRIAWRYEGVVGGAVAVTGEAALGAAARGFAARFFANLGRALARR